MTIDSNEIADFEPESREDRRQPIDRVERPRPGATAQTASADAPTPGQETDSDGRRSPDGPAPRASSRSGQKAKAAGAKAKTIPSVTEPLSPPEFRTCLEDARREGQPLAELILERKGLTEQALVETLERCFGVPRVVPSEVEIDARAIQGVKREIALRHTCMPISLDQRGLVLAMYDPSDFHALQDIQFEAGQMVRPVVAMRSEILEAIESHYGEATAMEEALAHIGDAKSLDKIPDKAEVDLDNMSPREAASLAPVVRLCNSIVDDAARHNASDIHIEPTSACVQVRLRIDGVLRDHKQIPHWLLKPVVSRLKILASLDIAERRLPQDGKLRAQTGGEAIDIRVSTLPTRLGEKVVMRLLGSTEIPTFDRLGLAAASSNRLLHSIQQSQGMVLVTGPTGAGKTTTLYSMLARRQSPEVNIVTVEDPIEYQLKGINQVQVNAKAGLTFPRCLRSILRQDPDVVLVGEIRDLDTAEIAFRAAMTGHLVLSTVHTNSSVATVMRLIDLGLDPMMLTSSLQLIIAQRLARRLCTECREPYHPERDVRMQLRLSAPDMRFFRATGCKACSGTGYAGRVGIFETVRMTSQLKQAIHDGASEPELRRAATDDGAMFLLEDAVQKIHEGMTSPDEVLRVVPFDQDEVSACPHCAQIVEPDFASCPYCMGALKRKCGCCDRSMKAEWKMCPYCSTPIGGSGGKDRGSGAGPL